MLDLAGMEEKGFSHLPPVEPLLDSHLNPVHHDGGGPRFAIQGGMLPVFTGCPEHVIPTACLPGRTAGQNDDLTLSGRVG